MNTTPGAEAPPTTESRHVDAIRLAGEIAWANPARTTTELAADLENMWTPQMWRVAADDALVDTPDTATQLMVVAILRGTCPLCTAGVTAYCAEAA